MDKSIYWAWAISNGLCVSCWVALAMVFDRWWIALFSLLFTSSIKFRPVTWHYRVCDKCGVYSEHATTPEAALENALKAGWTHCKDKNKDYCPHCSE